MYIYSKDMDGTTEKIIPTDFVYEAKNHKRIERYGGSGYARDWRMD